MAATARRRSRGTPVRERPGAYVGFRTSREEKAQLDEAAKAGFRSISTETQVRVRQSFLLDFLLGRQLTGLLIAVAHVMQDAGRRTAFNVVRYRRGGGNDPLLEGEAWMHDPVAWAQAVKAAITVLEAARPEGDAKPEWLGAGEGEFPPEDLAANLGETLAERFLAALARPEYGAPAYVDLARFAGEKLGPEITARIDARLQWAEPRNPIHERAAAEDRSNGDEAAPEG